MNNLLQYIIILAIFLIIDVPVITYFNKNMYATQFERVQGTKKVNTQRTIFSAFLAYLLLAFAIYHFAIKQKSVLNGFLLGLCIYGIYNTTNLATLQGWGIYEAVADTLWGSFLFAGITWLYLRI